MLPVILGAATLGYAIYCCVKSSNDQEQTDNVFDEDEALDDDSSIQKSAEQTSDTKFDAWLSDPDFRKKFKEFMSLMDGMAVINNSTAHQST